MRAARAPRALPAAALAAALALSSPPLLLAAAPPARAADPPPREAPAGERVILNAGHLDLAARLRDGRLEFRIKDGTVAGAPVWREPEDVLLHFDPRHEIVIPPREEVPQFEGFGEPGRSLWVDKDFESEEGLLWPGWNTTEILPADVRDGVSVSFPRIQGPGRFVLGRWEDDPDLGVRIGVTVDSARSDPGGVRLPAFTHSHPLWILDTQGVYRITMELTATLPSGQRVSDRETLAVAVGNVDPRTVEPGDGIPDPPPTTTPPPTTPSPTTTPAPGPTLTATGTPGPAPAPTSTPTGTPAPTSAAPTPTPTATGTGGTTAPAPTDPVTAPPPASVPADASSAAGTGAQGGGRLASTGAGTALPAGIAAAVTSAGAAALVLVRRHRRKETAR
ncbi:choice-of-anchor M domain-containing protein [Streptomyces sp. NPDC127114]|uniref:choice-of-anchor M domain-containing protein n=1 Tax=Streptomyces sp. NPDC127114 TaxID=3345366 RepID=UPI0036318511